MEVRFPEQFKLTTLLLEDKGLHLESNGGPYPKSQLGGAAFMSSQKNASGTIWKVIPNGNGFFQLTSLCVEDKGLVLESNGGPYPKSQLGGAAFMSSQKNATGTMWRAIPRNNGYFQLTSLCVQDKKLVLEGNGGVHPECQLGGAALMSPQRNATGTMWKIVEV